MKRWVATVVLLSSMGCGGGSDVCEQAGVTLETCGVPASAVQGPNGCVDNYRAYAQCVNMHSNQVCSGLQMSSNLMNPFNKCVSALGSR